jgi:adenine-specific DNA-methyltransferase
VVETNYCITLDRVPKELYPEIAANDAQREEWVRLFGIDKIEKDLNQPGYSNPLTKEFLTAHPSLVLDTALFTPQFIDRILIGFDSLDENIDAILVRSENFNALAMLRPRYKGSIKCVYNDPPYNTGRDGFSYKDSYQHSSWLSMFGDRLAMAAACVADDGVVVTSINDIEQPLLRLLMASAFGDDNYIANMVWKGATDNNPTRVAVEHEYLLIHAKSKNDLAAQWSTTESEAKQMMLNAFAELKASTSSFEELESEFAKFTTENREVLGDLYRYRRSA